MAIIGYFLSLADEAMEEGEIRVSPVRGVMEGCERVMGEVLSHLHTATQHHLTSSGANQSPGTRGGVELAVGLQNALREWCGLLMKPEKYLVW